MTSVQRTAKLASHAKQHISTTTTVPVRRSARLAVQPIASLTTDTEPIAEPARKRVKTIVEKIVKPAIERSAVAAASAPKKATRSVNLAQIPVHPVVPSELFKGGTISRAYEKQLVDEGIVSFCGVDEAGRGPLAGPVVAAACQIDIDAMIEGINDSKLLNESQRDQLFETLISHPQVRYAVRIIEPAVIDEINILQATLRGMRECIDELNAAVPLKVAFIDGPMSPLIDGESAVEARCVIKGDSRVYSIAAASVIAKVTRDRLMDQYHDKYPVYNFNKHKGYGVAAHLQAIKQHGPCEIHRMTFAPMKHMKQSEPKPETSQITDSIPSEPKKRAARSRKT